jgi:hypothetical protein
MEGKWRRTFISKIPQNFLFVKLLVLVRVRQAQFVALDPVATEQIRNVSPLPSLTAFCSVLRIQDVYPGSELFPFRIPDTVKKIPDHGSGIRIKEFKYF